MNATAFQRKMYNDAMGEHDRTCCTADEPCRMRAALTQGMGSMDLAPDVQAAGRSFDRKTGSYAEPTSRRAGSGRASAVRLATEAQLGYLRSLMARHGHAVEEDKLAKLSTRDASELITMLKNRPVANPQPVKPEPTTSVVLEDGMYRVDGVVYKVQHAVHGSGRQYAKRLTQYGNDWTFEYAAGAIRKLRPEHRMTLDEAREFGALYGVCCRCGTTLTDEESIARGIGPVCAEKF